MKGNISIGRDSRDCINITVRDEKSSITFVEVKMTPEQFGMVITGLSMVDIEFEVRGLESVGKEKITESRTIEYPHGGYDRKEMEEWLKENVKEDGWKVNSYLGSRGSIYYVNNKTFIKYSVYKFV